jgi:hypothetical protein
MANIGGFTGIPDTLLEAQAMIVSLLNQIKQSGDERAQMGRDFYQAVAMIENARKALNYGAFMSSNPPQTQENKA